MMTLLETAHLEADLEDAAVEVGIQRYRDEQDYTAKRDGFDKRDNVSKLIRGAIPILSAALKGWMDHTALMPGKKPQALKPLTLLDPDIIAFIGLSRTFNGLGHGGSITDINIGIGKTIELELEASAIKEMDPEAAKRFKSLAKTDTREAAAERRHGRLASTMELSLNWDRPLQLMVGNAVLGVILTSLSEIFIREMGRSKSGMLPIIRLTEEADAELVAMTDAVAWLKPPLQPMVTMPNAWKSFDTGCYNDRRLAKAAPLVRTHSSEHRRLVHTAIADGSMKPCLDALNAIQETRWAIDTRILPVVLWAKREGLQPSSSFPASKLPSVPKAIPQDEWADMAPDRQSAISRSRRAIKDLRAAAGIDAGVFAADTDTAAFLADMDAFYLPHSLDFRGRAYAIPHFNHQRSDHMKALFHFADGVPLGEDGGRFLMIHLANTGDFDKVSKKPMADRIRWVKDNEGDILWAATDPQGAYDYWSQADSPFCFLQACMEYLAWMRSGFSIDFLSTCSGAADGSCSGLQHYSAITRAKDEAHHVNLTPRDTVGDIYQVTADAATITLKAAAADGDLKAARVLAVGFGRSNVKRNVMTYFYGSGKFGMRDQHMEDTMRPLSDQVAMGSISDHPYQFVSEASGNQDGGFGCAQVLAAHTFNAVVSVAPKADEAASWIQDVAAILAHESLSMIWTTPAGLPVVQRYSEYTSKQINLWLYNRDVMVPIGDDKIDPAGNVLSRIRLLVREAPTKRVAKKRMRSASSPNVIHSMDGAHLQLSVNAAVKAGIHHFAMIHDSFGTHFGNMGVFNRCIREAFVATYADYCPLEAIDTYARSVLSDAGVDKLPPVPAKGDLDLNDVLLSLYAFA